MSVRWHTTQPSDPTTPPALWRDGAGLGWLPTPQARVIVHVANPSAGRVAGQSAGRAATDTARSLVDFRREHAIAPRIEMIAPPDVPAWPGVERLDLRTRARYHVDVACLRDGARVPEDWLDDVFVVTIAGAAPDARLGLRCVLAAQAEILDATAALDLDAIFVAHRLVRASLSVACGTVSYGDPGSGTWWAISPDDVALERAVALQAGAEPDALPVFRHFARHEARTPTAFTMADGAPTLRGYVAPARTVALGRFNATLAERRRRVLEDLRLGMQNLRRLPQFLERRVPAMKRVWRAA